MSGFAFQQPFDARQVEPSQGIDPVPAGEYKVRISDSVPEPLKDNKPGGLLKLTLEIIEGPFTGRTLFYRLNLFNPSPQATEIAYRQLSALCHVTGVFQLQHSQQLHGIPFVAVVGNDGQYNDIKRVKDLNGGTPGKTGASQMATPAQAPVGMPPTVPPAAMPPAWSAQPTPGAPSAALAPAPPQAWPGQQAFPGMPAAPPQAAPTAPVASWGPPAPAVVPPAPAPGAMPPWSGQPSVAQPAQMANGNAPWTPGAAPAPPAWQR